MNSVLPYSVRTMMAYPAWQRWFATTFFKLVDLLRFWQYPLDVDIEDFDSLLGNLYYLYISEKPVLRADKGRDLESFFLNHRHPPMPLLPAGFRKHTSLTMSAVGDLICYKAHEALDQSEGTFYEHVADRIFNADISIANLESMLTTGPIADMVFGSDMAPKVNAKRAQFNAVKGHRGRQYTVFQTANNHVFDSGMEAFDTTHDVLEAEGFYYVGTNRKPEDAKKGLILTVNGIRLGIVAATWGVNNRALPEGKEYLVNLVRFHRHDGHVDLSLLEEQMTYCRSQGCDLVILCLHWGFEWEFFPRQHQISQAHSLVESGADVIIGHHAHVIQPVEWYRSQRDPDRVVPILYGLGNLSPFCWISHTVLSLIANIRIAKGFVNGVEKTLVEGLDLTPVLYVESEQDGKPCARIEALGDFVGQSAEGHMRAYARQVAEYADLVLGRDWRDG